MRGCSYVPGGSHILTCADDKTIKLWDAAKWNDVPVDTIVSKHMVSFVLCTNEIFFTWTAIYASTVKSPTYKSFSTKHLKVISDMLTSILPNSDHAMYRMFIIE